jgi:hypothetical protein
VQLCPCNLVYPDCTYPGEVYGDTREYSHWKQIVSVKRLCFVINKHCHKERVLKNHFRLPIRNNVCRLRWNKLHKINPHIFTLCKYYVVTFLTGTSKRAASLGCFNVFKWLFEWFIENFKCLENMHVMILHSLNVTTQDFWNAGFVFYRNVFHQRFFS